MPLPDLITTTYAQRHLNLSSADLTRLPDAITAVSTLVRKYCGRYLSRRPSLDGSLGPIDELITPPLGGEILLNEYPINDIFRVSTARTTILSVINNDSSTNQRATVKLLRTGDPITGFTATGLYLERWASAVKIPSTILFTSLPTQTIAALTTAINNLGGGWNAIAEGQGQGGAIDYSQWPVTELAGGQGAMGALQDPAGFVAWVDDAEIERDDQAGIITLVNSRDNAFSATRFGPTMGLQFGDDQVRGANQGVRVLYDAGYDPIPDDLMQACVELVKAMLERKTTSSTFTQERTANWQVRIREEISAITEAARQTLALYKSHSQ